MTDEPSKAALDVTLGALREDRPTAWNPAVICRIALALDKARAEEREGCAKIADQHGDEEPGMHGYEPACRDIAAAIRNRADRT